MHRIHDTIYLLYEMYIDLLRAERLDNTSGILLQSARSRHRVPRIAYNELIWGTSKPGWQGENPTVGDTGAKDEAQVSTSRNCIHGSRNERIALWSRSALEPLVRGKYRLTLGSSCP